LTELFKQVLKLRLSPVLVKEHKLIDRIGPDTALLQSPQPPSLSPKSERCKSFSSMAFFPTHPYGSLESVGSMGRARPMRARVEHTIE
jgi:hypothetical protein